ncbi:MAG: UDP-N-acetylmuramate--L-alanine ligase [candidate division Zixibacteria bacterium]|nr:UDP-N-acetylmuramate--L-alanine ligase [candidate division Zixibacteria bacterium]
MTTTVVAKKKVAGFGRRRIMFGRFKRLFFVGIGGAGMSGIAEILHNLGYQIQGSDTTPGQVTDYLASLGIAVHHEHRAANLQDADVVVISSAVGEDNPEVVEARRLGVPVIKRAEMLGELMRLKFSVGVSGTHGKTTTTSMIGRVLQQAGYEPTIIVGGVVAGLGTGAALGGGDYLVAEADEYDRSFLSMFPSVAVVTNLEGDHLECYDGMDDLRDSFLSYMNRVPFYGLVVISADDDNLARLRPRISRPYVTFGFDPEADYRAAGITTESGRTTFAVHHHGDLLGKVVLRVPGRHNVANAMAAIATCHELEVPFPTIADGLLGFTGVERRFEIVGEVDDILVIDDYAHHPTEIKATIATAKEIYDRRLVVVFQPHLYSRTRDLAPRFAEALSAADRVLLADIYPAREKPIEGVTSQLIADEARRMGAGEFVCIGPRRTAARAVIEEIRSGDLLLIMGAGSITLIRNDLLEALRSR